MLVSWTYNPSTKTGYLHWDTGVVINVHSFSIDNPSDAEIERVHLENPSVVIRVIEKETK